jgi:peptidoglycan hydrolase-like protein with peptidoglycan-binding domain
MGYDKETEEAVERFQKINGLKVTGDVERIDYMKLGLLE